MSLSIIIVSIRTNGIDQSPMPSVGQWLISWSVCLYVRKVYCGRQNGWYDLDAVWDGVWG